MKRYFLMAVIAAATLTISPAMAQGPGAGCSGHGQGQGQGHGEGMKKEGHCGIPNLTDDQKAKIDVLKLDHKKKMLDINNQINEKEAHLITVTTGDKSNKDEAYKTIDEISVLRAIKEKLKLDHKLAVRALLTDEQKVWFDMNGMKGHGGMHQKGDMGGGHGAGCGQGHTQGNCSGQKTGGCSGNGQKPAGNCSGQGKTQGTGSSCCPGK